MSTYIIPGLSMSPMDFQFTDCLPEDTIVLENPGTGSVPDLDRDNDLNEIAARHADTIKRANPKELIIAGISMGGMILSIIASRYRTLLPENARFYFLVTSSNSPSTPAIRPSYLQNWTQAKPGDIQSFAKVLADFFSPTYIATTEGRRMLEQYCTYRSQGGNRQPARSFFRQVGAIQSFDGEASFPLIPQKESVFIGGKDDLSKPFTSSKS